MYRGVIGIVANGEEATFVRHLLTEQKPEFRSVSDRARRRGWSRCIAAICATPLLFYTR